MMLTGERGKEGGREREREGERERKGGMEKKREGEMHVIRVEEGIGEVCFCECD